MLHKTIFIYILTVVILLAQPNTESDDFSYPLKLYNQQFYDLAAQQFVKFYTSHPSSDKVPEAKYYTGMSYFNLGEFNQARIEFQSAAIEYPASKRAGENWFKTGECYLKLNNKTDAAKAFETIRFLYPNDPLAPESIYRAGVLYLETSDTDKAQQLFRVLLDRYDTSEQYYFALVKTGQLFFQIGELQKATDLLNKVLDNKLDQKALAEAYLLLGEINLKQGDFASAKKHFIKIIDGFPNSGAYSNAIHQLALILIRQGNFIEAQKYLLTGISKETDANRLRTLHGILGDVYFLDGKYALAQKEYLNQSQEPSDKDDFKQKLKYAFTLHKQNLTNDALDAFSEVLQAVPENDEQTAGLLLKRYLRWLRNLNNPDKAIDLIYQQMSRFQSERINIKLSIAIADYLGKKNNWRGVIQKLSPYILLPYDYPEKDDIIYLLGFAYEKTGSFEQSADLYNQIVREFASSKYYRIAANRLNYLQNYKLVDKNIAVIKLADLMGRMLDKEDFAKLQFEHANIYYAYLKDYKQAEKYLLRTLDNYTERSGDVHLYLGKTYQMLGENDQLSEAQANGYLEKAYEQYKLAVQNIATCSNPDEASWLRVRSSMSIDTMETGREKTIIEALIKNYPNSPYLEEWYKTLAYSLAFNEKLTPVSVSYFRKLINDYPDSPSYSYYLYGYAQLIQQSNHDEAIKMYKRIASEYPYSTEAANALTEVANYYADLNQYQEANILYDKLITTYYYSEEAEDNLKKLGQSYLHSGEYDNAIRIINQQLAPFYLDDQVLSREFLSEDDAENIYFLASAYLGNADQMSALKYNQLYLRIATSGHYTDNARFDIGKIYYDLNQKGVALENFTKISDSNESLFLRARYYMGEIYFEQGRYDQAVTIYSQLSANRKGAAGNIELESRWITGLIRQGKFSEANPLIKTFSKTHSEDKNHQALFVIEQGKYYKEKKEYGSAIKFFEEVKKKYKSSDYVDDAEYNLALVYLTQNKNEDAFKILSNFYTNYPKSDQLPAALNSLGTLYFRSEKYDNAIMMFKNALESCKDQDLKKSVLSNLIKTYSLTSFWDAAQATARRYVEEFPDAEDDIDKKIIVAQAYINLNQFDNAIEYLRRIKFEADSEREPEIQYYIGEAYLKAGQYENAIAEFVKIPLLSKKTKLQWEASALYYSGQSYEKLGRIDDAVRMYREIVERPGIDLVLKKEAEKRIQQIQ